MEQGQLNWISSFIWGIADDVLRDVYVRRNYRDVFLPMTVIRRLDAMLEPTRQAVRDTKERMDKEHIANPEMALWNAAGQDFCSTFKWGLKDLKARSSRQQIQSDSEAFLDGFSANVQEILEKYKFQNQIPTLVEANILGTLIEKFLSAFVNLSPNLVLKATVCEAAVVRLRQEVEIAGEYHTRLITEVVSGSLDVREPATHLPDSAEADATLYETGEEFDEPAEAGQVGA